MASVRLTEEEREALASSVRRVLGDHGGTAFARRHLEDPPTGGGPVWQALCDLGVLGLLQPASGAGLADAGAVAQELGRVASPLPWVSCAVAALSAAALGEAAELCADLAEGRRIATVALLEPGGGYAWRSPAVEADGRGRLHGQKVHVPDLLACDAVVVSARDQTGLGLWLVNGPLSATASPSVDGTRPEGALQLDGVLARRLPLPGDHTALVAAVLDRWVAVMVADGVGAGARALELALEHANNRHQFGRPVGTFQAVQHLCVDAFQALELARTACGYALSCLDDAAEAGDVDGAAARDAHRAVVMAKACASSALQDVTSAAVGVLGGTGFTWEHDIGLFYKRALSLATAHGGEGDQLAELADLVLG